MSKPDQFDPNGVGVKGSLFGLPYDTENAGIVVIPVPWDVTVSYGSGTAQAPAAILEASSQIDYAQADINEAWKLPVAMTEIPGVWLAKGKRLRKLAERYIRWLEEGSSQEKRIGMLSILEDVNTQCTQLMDYVEQECRYWHSRGKLTILLGGDHSTPLGHIRALANAHDSFGILQIDAHADLRRAYEGFEYSHASIMYNALQSNAIERLVQIGVRDFCEEEKSYIANSDGRVKTFFDSELKAKDYQGVTWDSQCDEIVAQLPEKVYISLDIDGLDPKLCPNTGTPVPGGLELEQVVYLMKKVMAAGKTIIGCDLNEVSPGANEWDANVGARVLFQLSLALGQSQGLI